MAEIIPPPSAEQVLATHLSSMPHDISPLKDIVVAPGTNVKLPTFSKEVDLINQFLNLGQLVNVAYLAYANQVKNSTDLNGDINYIINEATNKYSLLLSNVNPIYVWEVDTYCLFGYSATVTRVAQTPYNALIYRGTVTIDETKAVTTGWSKDDDINLKLPTGSLDPASLGQVNGALADFYQGTLDGIVTSLAASTISAVRNTKRVTPKDITWAIAAHSLGQALIEMGALDCVLSNLIHPYIVTFVTFGGLVLGQQTFADNFSKIFKYNGLLRFENICDFVPTIQGLIPYTKKDGTPPYIQIGEAYKFAWHNSELWENHSLTGVYLPMMTPQYFSLITSAKINWPVRPGEDGPFEKS